MRGGWIAEIFIGGLMLPKMSVTRFQAYPVLRRAGATWG